LALVILPDHWHALIRPYPDIVIEDVVGGIKANLMKRISKTEKRASILNGRAVLRGGRLDWYLKLFHVGIDSAKLGDG